MVNSNPPSDLSRGTNGWRFPQRMSLSFDYIWIIAGLLFLGVIVSLSPVVPHDFWWHLKVGELIAINHKIPSTNIFAWSLPADTPFVYASWLGELLFYRLYRWGGLEIIIFLRNITTVLAFGLMAFEARRQSRSWKLAALALFVATAMSASNFHVRPQMVSVIFFPILYIIINRYLDKSIHPVWLLVCPVLFLAWGNIHGGYVLGLILIALFLVGEVIAKLLWPERARSWKVIGWLGLVAVLCSIAVAINHETIGIYRYIFSLTSNQSVQGLTEEWKAPTPNAPDTIAFFLSVIILLVVFMYSRYVPSATEALLLIVFLWLAWTGKRSIIWYAMILIPILAKVLAEIFKKSKWIVNTQRSTFNTVIFALALLVFFALQPWFIESLPLPSKYTDKILQENPVGPLLSTSTPIGAAEYLKNHSGGNMFNEMGYGSYLIWAVPEQKVFTDTRIELFPYDLWLDYIKVSNGVMVDEIFARYGIDRVLLDKKLQGALSSFLENKPDWRLEYEDLYSQIWKKANP